MADNSTQGGVDTIRDKDRAGVKTQIFGIDLGIGTATESLMAGSMPVAFLKPTTASLTSASINLSASGDNTVIAGVSAQTIRVMKLFLVCNAAVNITFKDGASTALTGVIAMPAGGSISLDFDGEPWFVTSTANNFVLNLSSAQQVSGRIYYTQS